MTQESTSAPTPNTDHPETSAALYVTFTITAAFVAASAAGLSLALGLAPWAMFMGWVAYFTRKPSPAEGLRSFACIVIGLSLGTIASITVGKLAPALGSLALPTAVFATGLIVIAARGLPVLNNLIGYFIGLITFFAAHLEPALLSIAELAGATGLGSFAGWVAQSIEGRARRAMHA
jgi:hypothetical protein